MKFGWQSLSVEDKAIPFNTSAKKHVNKFGKFGGSERQKQYRRKSVYIRYCSVGVECCSETRL